MDEFNITYSASEKNTNKKLSENTEGPVDGGFLKLDFIYRG